MRIIEESDVALQFWPGFDQENYVANKVIGTQVLMDQEIVFNSL